MTSQLFESASLEEALAEVRDTVGPHAKIVRAEKVRRGGIAGFFSKESFVLAVEHDATQTVTQAVTQAVAHASPVVPNPDRTLQVPQPLSWQQPAPADSWTDPYQDRFTAPMDTPAAYTLAALADFADRSDEIVDSRHSLAVADTSTSVSTETPLFGQVLRDVSRATALDHELPAGSRWDGLMPEFEVPFRSVMPLVSAPEAPVAPPVVREIPLEVYRQPVQQPWWQTLAAVAESQAADAADAAQAAEVRARRTPPAPLTIDLSTPRPTPPPPPVTVPADRLGDELFPPDATTPSVPVIEPVKPFVEPVVEPDPLGAAPAANRSTAALAAGLATINAALGPALLPGSVIAVVGHPADATRVAARVAVAAKADPFAIHIASQDAVALHRSGLPTGRQVSSLDEAILRSRRWPSRPTPLVVVIDGRDSHWARTVLDAIEATTVLALPSPAQDDDEVRDWVSELGGVQALLVDDTCAATPEALVLHGIPALLSPWSLEDTRRAGVQ